MSESATRSILKVLDVSTGHLTPDEREMLEDGELPGQSYSNAWGGLVSTYSYEADNGEDPPEGTSPTLLAVMAEAVRLGCGYVRFDADGAHLDDFPTFDDEPETAS